MKSYPVLALKSTFFSGKLLKSGFSEEGGVPPRGGVHVITQMRKPSDVSLYFPDLSPMLHNKLHGPSGLMKFLVVSAV